MNKDGDVTTQQLEDEGFKKFTEAFALLMKTLKEKRARALSSPRMQGAAR